MDRQGVDRVGSGTARGSGGADRSLRAGRGTDANERPERMRPGVQRPGLQRPVLQAPAPRPGVTADDVEPDVRRELRSLGRERAERVALHLASAVAALGDDDAGAAVDHADAAVELAPRLGVVRETAGLVRYRAGDFAHALRELRTARRMGAGTELVPVIVDCERALGRHARALELAQEARSLGLDRSAQVELAMVVAGTRRDLGDLPAALRELELPELRSAAPSSIRLRYAYADLLEGAGRADDALSWFSRVSQVDSAGDTDAAERVLMLHGLSIESLDDEIPVEDSHGAVLDDGAVADAESGGASGRRVPDALGPDNGPVPSTPDGRSSA